MCGKSVPESMHANPFLNACTFNSFLQTKSYVGFTYRKTFSLRRIKKEILRVVNQQVFVNAPDQVLGYIYIAIFLEL